MTLYFAKLCYTHSARSSGIVSDSRTWIDLPNPNRFDGKWPGQGREEVRLAIREHLKHYPARDTCDVLLIPEHRHHVLPLGPEHLKPPPITR